MNIKSNICLLLSCGFLTILLMGCDNFLSHKDPSNLNTGNYFTQPSHAEGIVNATYESLYPVQSNASWLMTELRTGALNSTFTPNGGFPDFKIISDLQMSADHPAVNNYWVSHYRGIGNANLAIAEIPNIEMDATTQNRLLGEARFLRAYYYFNLVRVFGEVPLITESVDLGSPDLEPSRSSVESIYQLIVEDLTAAESSGLPFNDSSGRVTLGAIKSLLADVYLTMAGYPLQMGTEYYTLARDKAKEVIDSQEYSLFDSYLPFRESSNDNTGEHIFSVQYLQGEQNNDVLQIGLPPFKFGVSAYSSEQGFGFARDEFVASYEAGDKRAEERVFFFTSYSSESDRNETVQFPNQFIYKFWDEQAHLNTAQSGLNWQVIRYADVLLDFAEASNEVTGPTTEAYEAVNKIRRRAELNDLSGLTKTEFREAIWKERWHELIYENEIWFDMVRTRKAYDIEDDAFNDYVGHSFVDGSTLQERDLLFPLPTNELRNNENLTQNPGY
ncbi:RagB/SusD family nutrient uptake outer membrane protein [Aliifodinibius sp. S!AR15-10]|uniref:RagB/SusD family nutrient uptake outer membrane protein n=1 Tax=Aliifodinibius sp. S!AR15-10 TaxID=2950437 RepID=UPI002860677F|nr:RagB/SusD family nutrient uptake outer membrane protein [Aliifodinibius sp. S!AR15-10]MDR8394557.1 RagB/SusD family nutrient uptake outer membrane protein [Aliifodinibius sp. S!AR15-10]